MPLNCHSTKVADLAPLEGMKLAELDCSGSAAELWARHDRGEFTK